QSMPANDGRRPYDDHRIAPIEEPGEQRKADARHVIHTSGLDATLDIPRELSAKNQILSAIALDERKNKTPSHRMSETTPMIARANCCIRSSCQSRPTFAGAGHRSTRGANYCGPHAAGTARPPRRAGVATAYPLPQLLRYARAPLALARGNDRPIGSSIES